VDNLHQRAGSRHVLELHGNIERSYCIDCRAFESDLKVEELQGVPRCRKCGGLVRPDVVWFGELLPYDAFTEAVAAAGRCDAFLCVGTSGVVYPAASLPYSALEHGAFVVEINREQTDLSYHTRHTLLGKAGEILPKLIEALDTESKGVV
jgi:NAD-dependent deacetylase